MVIELATTMVLFTGAGLLGKSLYRLLHVDIGFQVDHLATLHVQLPEPQFPGDPEQVAFTRRLLDRVESLPGVRAAGITSVLPASCDCNTDWVRIAGRPYNGNHITVNERDVSARFFQYPSYEACLRAATLPMQRTHPSPGWWSSTTPLHESIFPAKTLSANGLAIPR